MKEEVCKRLASIWGTVMGTASTSAPFLPSALLGCSQWDTRKGGITRHPRLLAPHLETGGRAGDQCEAGACSFQVCSSGPCHPAQMLTGDSWHCAGSHPPPGSPRYCPSQFRVLRVPVFPQSHESEGSGEPELRPRVKRSTSEICRRQSHLVRHVLWAGGRHRGEKWAGGGGGMGALASSAMTGLLGCGLGPGPTCPASCSMKPGRGCSSSQVAVPSAPLTSLGIWTVRTEVGSLERSMCSGDWDGVGPCWARLSPTCLCRQRVSGECAPCSRHRPVQAGCQVCGWEDGCAGQRRDELFAGVCSHTILGGRPLGTSALPSSLVLWADRAPRLCSTC